MDEQTAQTMLVFVLQWYRCLPCTTPDRALPRRRLGCHILEMRGKDVSAPCSCVAHDTPGLIPGRRLGF